MLISNQLIAQNQYRLRLNLTSVDTITKVACYDMEMSNYGPEEWALGAVNIGLVYDASVATYVIGSANPVSGNDIDFALGNIDPKIISAPELTNLPYRDNLGFLRINLTSNFVTNGLILPPDSTWVSFINLCFDISFDDITNPSTCFQMNFVDEVLRASGSFPDDFVAELTFGGTGDFVQEATEGNINLVPDESLDACFVLEENSEALCSDGKDNDEDGLIDCLDVGCVNSCSEASIMTCNDGIDNDSDGLIDCDDDECSTLYQSFSPSDPTNCPDLNNGRLEFTFGAGEIEISIDGGLTYSQTTTIENLDTGTYDILYRNIRTGCMEVPLFSPVILTPAADCAENTDVKCADGIDNDGDGLVDCADSDCSMTIPCIEMPTESTTLACGDGIDNDSDGLIDCTDPDCQLFNFCRPDDLIYMPNVFSLRSSQGNNLLIPRTKDNELLEIVSYDLYDRNGNKVFEQNNVLSDNPSLMWDGIYDKQQVVSGVYVYVIRVAKDGNIFTYKGDVTLLK